MSGEAAESGLADAASAQVEDGISQVSAGVGMDYAPAEATAVPVAEEDLSVGYLIGRVRASVMDGLDSEFDQFALTGAQFAVLKHVADGTSRTAADLCRTLYYDTGSMTRMLDRLEKKGFLTRERCTSDRRVVYLRMTTLGRTVLPRLRTAAGKVLCRHLAGFHPGEVDTLKQYLGRMIDNGSTAKAVKE